MNYLADLHVHSHYSRATSKASHLHGLAAWAAVKGIAVVATGNYEWMWWADAVLALLAALVNLPIKESKPAPRLVAGAA